MASDSGKRPFLPEGKLLRDPSKGSGLWGTLGHQELSLEQCLCRSLDDEGQALRDDEAADSSLPLGACIASSVTTHLQTRDLRTGTVTPPTQMWE